MAKHEEITQLSIDPPGAIARLLGTIAVESLPKRLGERAVVNVRWDEPTRKFVPRR